MGKNSIYRVTFYSQNTIYEIYAKNIAHGSLYGFIEVGDLVFGKQNNLLVDPMVERLKTEFAGVSRTFIPMHIILRIDEVEKEGIAKIREQTDKTGNVTQFPLPMYPPPEKK